MPEYLNALSGKGCTLLPSMNTWQSGTQQRWENFTHGSLSLGSTLQQNLQLRKKEAYLCDITYSTNSEVVLTTCVTTWLCVKTWFNVIELKNLPCVVVHLDWRSADSVDRFWSDNFWYEASSYHADAYVKTLTEDDYIIDVPSKTIGLSDSGIDKAESYFNLENLRYWKCSFDSLIISISCQLHHDLDVDYGEDQKSWSSRPIY